jgi:anti-sigma B factor antagonist
MLHVRFAETNGALIVTPLVPRLDAAAAPDFRATVGAAAAGRRLVVVSLSHVRTVDASGLAALVSVLQRMAPGGELRIAHAVPRVRALLASTGLDELFPSFEDASAALQA